MAASNAYVALSATFPTGSGAIDGITDITATISGTTTDLLTDANSSVEAVFVDAVVADVTITATAIDEISALQPGDTGALVITFQKRKEGRGAAGSGNKVATFANAVLTNISAGSPTTGVGSSTLTFRCSGPDSANPVSWA